MINDINGSIIQLSGSYEYTASRNQSLPVIFEERQTGSSWLFEDQSVFVLLYGVYIPWLWSE